MSLVKVWTDIGAKKPVPLLAKIIEKDGVILTIKYLTEGKDHTWKYEDDTYEIDDSSVAEYLKTDCETDLGFMPLDDGFIKEELSDEDYEPSDYESSETSDDDEDVEDDENSVTEEPEDEETDDEDDGENSLDEY